MLKSREERRVSTLATPHVESAFMQTSAHLYFEGTQPLRNRRRRVLKPARAHQFAPSVQGDPFFAWLFDRAGISAERYRLIPVQRRLAACLRAVGARSVDEAYQRIDGDSGLLEAAINTVLLGVTEFVRDSAVFDAIESEIISRWRFTTPKPRVWSAACSDGQELFSVAVLLADAGLLQGSTLLGTDCRRRAICQARTGVFPAGAVERFGGARARYFEIRGGQAVASPQLRHAMKWSVADLFDRIESGPWDMILWRNMAIYLTNDAAEQIWRALIQELSPGGYLVVGKADYPPAGLPLRRIAPCIYEAEQD